MLQNRGITKLYLGNDNIMHYTNFRKCSPPYLSILFQLRNMVVKYVAADLVGCYVLDRSLNFLLGDMFWAGGATVIPSPLTTASRYSNPRLLENNCKHSYPFQLIDIVRGECQIHFPSISWSTVTLIPIYRFTNQSCDTSFLYLSLFLVDLPLS